MTETRAITVHVRAARRDDVPAIVHLLADDTLGASREQPTEPPPQAYWDAFDAISAQRGNEVLVAEADGEVVGCLQLTVIPGLSRMGATRGQLEGVRVSSKHRGRRIGEALVEAATDRARDLGCTVIQLTTDKTRVDAHRFYERLGFESTHIGMKRAIEP
jgi:ribosomal protein S18 acetylase RimI-like enzyme